MFSAMFLPRTNDGPWFAIMATPTQLCSCIHEATIRGQLSFLSQSSMCGYYSRAVTNEGAASIRINTVRISLVTTKILCDFFRFFPERSSELRRARYIYAYIIIIVLLILTVYPYTYMYVGLLQFCSSCT